MNAARKQEMWAKINRVLREHELAQSEAMRVQVRETWDALRQQLTVISLESEMPENDDGDAP